MGSRAAHFWRATAKVSQARTALENPATTPRANKRALARLIKNLDQLPPRERIELRSTLHRLHPAAARKLHAAFVDAVRRAVVSERKALQAQLPRPRSHTYAAIRTLANALEALGDRGRVAEVTDEWLTRPPETTRPFFDHTRATLLAPDATPKEQKRAARDLLRYMRDWTQLERDAIRDVLPDIDPKTAARLRKAMDRTRTGVEQSRAARQQERATLDGALATLHKETTPQQARQAIRDLAKHRRALTADDRLAIRQDAIPRIGKDPERAKQVRALQKLAQRPRTLAQTVAATARTAIEKAHDHVTDRPAPGQSAQTPPQAPPREASAVVDAPQTPRETIETAIATLSRSDDPDASRRALQTLKQHQAVLKNEHRVALLDTVPAPHAARAARIARSGEHGQAFYSRYQITRAIKQLTTSPAKDPAAARRALWVIARHRAHLTDEHRGKLLDRATALPAGQKWFAVRLVQHGEAGRAFVQQARVARALEALHRPPAKATPERIEPDKAATVLRKDVIALNARQRAQARARAARLRADSSADRTTRHQARKLQKTLDKTATVRERTQLHLSRALKTLAKLPDRATRAERKHAAKTLTALHPHLSDRQRKALQRHAARLARNPRQAKLAKKLQRIADAPAPQRTSRPRRPKQPER